MKNLKSIIAAGVFGIVMGSQPATSATIQAAQGDILNVTMQGSTAFRDHNDQNALSQWSTFSLNGTSRTGMAGMFRMTAADAYGNVQDFLAFCLDPLQGIRRNNDYDVGSLLSTTALDRLSALMTNALGLVTTSTSAAAFQLAAWEIANEGQGALNLRGGAFTVSDNRTGARDAAQGWLDLITAGTWTRGSRDLVVLHDPVLQDLATNLAPVPVPAAGVLLLGGLAGLGALRGRRKKAA